MKSVKSDVKFPLVEESVLEFWKRAGIIEQGLKMNEGKEPFVFYDGPPFATGLPHYGHILAGTLKDIAPRYWAMRGKYVERRWGWDTHGLPVEFEMENELGLSGAQDIEKMGVAKFNEACRGIVLRYTQEWEKVITRTGRWADFKNNYRTMDPKFMESVWWVVQSLFNKGLVYQSFRVMPYSWRVATPLSNFEAGLNYKEVQDPAVTVSFPCVGKDFSFLAWTTTPWTLPSNLALAVNPDVEYVQLEEKENHKKWVLAQARVSSYFKDESAYKILKIYRGKDLEGLEYEPLFSYFADKKKDGAFKVVLGEHVTTGDGTGIVHTAPAFGEEDFAVCKKYGIPLANPVDDSGCFTAQVPNYKGQFVKDADKNIIKDLKSKGRIFKQDTLVHSYPFCWRTDTPLIYRAIPAWFVKVEEFKDRLVKNNQKTRWVPEHLRDGRFGNWLENARDWNISRNRYWGTPIPIWRCKPECGGIVCVGSVQELEKLSGKKVPDLHKHFVDAIEIPCPKCQSAMKRIPEVLDCWFESGSMPYAQAHYPFENKEKFENTFPADFIAEGIDQTRGWFYTLSVLSTALFDKPAFKNVIVNGLVLASDGKKMSKRLKNYPDPKIVLDTYGADALRAYLMTSPAAHADDVWFSEAGVKEIVRSVLLPLWNAYSFLVTYALSDGWDPKQFDLKNVEKSTQALDRWILSRLSTLIESVDAKMEQYHLYEVVPEVLKFIDELTNWYIRLSRRRFWQEEMNADKQAAYSTLYFVVREFSKVLAPILPFVTEEIYQNLCEGSFEAPSIHLCKWPVVKASHKSKEIEHEMDLIQQVVALGRLCRNNHKIKTRQPLNEVKVITSLATDQSVVEKYKSWICQELNVKTVSFSADETQWVSYTAKANSKVLGPRLGGKMQAFIQKIKNLSDAEIRTLQTKGSLPLDGETLTAQDVTIERKSKQEGLIETSAHLTLWLDSKLTPELIAEGRAREFVNRIQKLRKDKDFNVADKIEIRCQTTQAIQDSVTEHSDYVKGETLAHAIHFVAGSSWDLQDEIEGEKIAISVSKFE